MPPIVTLVDYGIGNLRSVEKALVAAGAEVRLTGDRHEVLAAEKLLLPGVGAFGDGMRGLQQRGLVDALRAAAERGTPLLGICLGMQVLFEAGDESPGVPGLGLLPGVVRRFDGPGLGLKTPHTGWNVIEPARSSPLLDGLPAGSYAYFNHGYYCLPADPAVCLAYTGYGVRFASVMGRGALFGVQFHPEKSQAVGLALLRNFVNLPAGGRP
ncbi:MAG: imidazole glycerol phosphate synthase subunit HisH [Chloroflexota bacterium]